MRKTLLASFLLAPLSLATAPGLADQHAAHVHPTAAPAPPPVSSSADVPLIDWDGFFSSVSASGAEFKAEVKAFEGKRVRLRGYAVVQPVPPDGLFLTRLPHERLHPDDAESLPWDAVGLLWRKGVTVAAVPKRPTFEGTLRIGTRRLGDESVILVLEDAVPWLPPSR
jgi:hypothetical protein